MNNKTVLVLVVAMFLTACGKGPGEAPGPGSPGCSTQQLNLILREADYALVPPGAKCVKRDTTVRMKITPTGGLTIAVGQVVMKPKINNPAWLSGVNSPDAKWLEFSVPADAGLDKYYNYLIEVEGLYIIDPIVKVVGNNMYMQAYESDKKNLDESELELMAK